MRIFILCFLLLLPISSVAATLHVPVEYSTIQAGIDACSEGDTVLVAPGTYTGEGNRDLNFNGVNLVLMSESGPEETIIDCEGEGRGLRLESGENSSSVVQGFTITNGFATSGGGISCYGVSPVFQDLILFGNRADASQYGGSGGGMSLSSCQVTMRRVHFIENMATGLSTTPFGTSWTMGGGLYCALSDTDMDQMVFRGNKSLLTVLGWDTCCPASVGGGIDLVHGTHRITNSIFDGNIASHGEIGRMFTSEGGAIKCNATAYIENCTFVGNEAGWGSAIYGPNAVISTSIFARNQRSAAIHQHPEVTCSIFWLNALSNDEYIGVGDNLFENPQFCGIESSGNYYLQIDSPCLPEHNDCDILIGALDAGCEETPVLLSSFTATPHGTDVQLHWRLEETAAETELRLTAEQSGISRQLVWREDSPGLYSAHDMDVIGIDPTSVLYRLESQYSDEGWLFLGTIEIDIPGVTISAELMDPFPNPFNPSVIIPVHMVSQGDVSLNIFDLAGRHVRQLAARTLTAGRHDITWDGCDSDGRSQSSGVYLVRLNTVNTSSVKRLTLIR